MLAKKPRVFFNEDQKDVLRNAYQHDPYPSQGTIEGLAGQLNVPPKTVINWFHNHRMRTKQQPGVTPTSEIDQIKMDDMDSRSDTSDVSEQDLNHYMNPQTREMSQWMFPSFEPVLNRGSSAHSDADAAPLNMKTEPLSDNDSISNVPSPIQQNIRRSSSHKRKCARPQWVYQGIQLDRSRADGEPGSIENGSEASTLHHDPNEENHVPNSLKDDRSEPDEENREKQMYRNSKIERIQKAIDAAEINWDDVNRKENIKKLQQNIQVRKSQEDWEF